MAGVSDWLSLFDFICFPRGCCICCKPSQHMVNGLNTSWDAAALHIAVRPNDDVIKASWPRFGTVSACLNRTAPSCICQKGREPGDDTIEARPRLGIGGPAILDQRSVPGRRIVRHLRAIAAENAVQHLRIASPFSKSPLKRPLSSLNTFNALSEIGV